MASVRQISRRIRSVQNTAKITKAMSMIAASKLRRSQDAATQGRSYADHMEKMVSSLGLRVALSNISHLNKSDMFQINT